MKRKIAVLTLLLFSITSVAFADTLPKFELPELEPLEVPELGSSFDEMLDNLRDRYSQKLESPDLPQVEDLPVSNMDDRERFKNTFGTLWSKPSLDSMPDKNFFSAYVGQMKVGSKMQENLTQQGLQGIKNFLEASPETKLHDLNAFQMSVRPKTEDELKAWLGGVGKSDLKLPAVPDQEEWVMKANPAWSLLDRAIKEATVPPVLGPVKMPNKQEQTQETEAKKGGFLGWLFGGEGFLTRWLNSRKNK